MAQSAKDKKLADLLKLFENDVDAAIEALRVEAALQKRKSAPKRKLGEAVVQLENAKKTYKLGKQKVEALKGASLEIKAGEFVALTGPSGSGKSTLLQLIGGLDKPTDGIVR
jgi:putative ABC transport system ATP-binding protein